jgi:hypothetical protein
MNAKNTAAGEETTECLSLTVICMSSEALAKEDASVIFPQSEISHLKSAISSPTGPATGSESH